MFKISLILFYIEGKVHTAGFKAGGESIEG